MHERYRPDSPELVDPPAVQGGLEAHECAVRRDLDCLRVPAPNWLSSSCADGLDADVLIVGAGMFGLSAAGSLMLRGVQRVRVLDRAPAGAEGPWRTWARMLTLRSPKVLPGLSFGMPSLTFRAWYEARFGAAAWQRLVKIPNATWHDYLAWVTRVLDVPVTNDFPVTRIVPSHDRVRVMTDDGRSMVGSRLVLATGRAGAGGFVVPDGVATDLWPDRAAHSAEPIDFARLSGLAIAVIGAGASAWDNAATALEAGAARVTMFCRRAALPQINKGRANANAGFFDGWAVLTDAQRWQLAHYLDRIQAPPPHETVLRTVAWPTFEIRFSSPVASAKRSGQGVELTMHDGSRHYADFLLLGTGFRTDLDADSVLAPLAPRILRWRDVYEPPADQRQTGLAAMPYLGQDFGLREVGSDAPTPLARIHLFNASSYLSHGPIALDIPSLTSAGARIATALSSHLFADDFDRQFARLQAWNDEHELATTPFYSPEWVNRLP